MKLYVLPVETACQGKCKFCITKFRETAKNEFLSVEKLVETLPRLNPEKIEITGGGEPTLHPNIDEIIGYCAKKAQTSMYTHGGDLRNLTDVHDLSYLCVSMAHHDEKLNRRIMGVYPDFPRLKEIKTPKKFSLMLHNSGINNVSEIYNYLDFVKGIASKLVIRQLFEHDYNNNNLKGEFVSSEKIFKDLGILEYKVSKQGNPIFNLKGLEVEVEYRSCACETNNLVLHADGNLYKGWSFEKL